MATLELIRSKVDSAKDLQSVVKTMKGLAAANIWQYERAVESLADYSRTIELGLQIALRNRSARIEATELHADYRLGAIVFGSDQGMVGRFNEQIAFYAVEQMDELGIEPENRSVLAVGLRVTSRLEDAGQSIEEPCPMPGSIAGVTPTVQDILSHIEAWREQRDLDHIVLFHNTPLGGAAYEPKMVHLLPLDLAWLQSLKNKPWPTKVLPTYRMDWSRLLAALIREYLFAALFRAFAESLASENASRLASMQAAEKNIEERLGELRSQFHRQRQQAITEELLDISAGFEALSSGRV